MPSLIAFSGLPGVGKTTLARALATEIQAVFLRVDSVEAAIKASVLKIHPAEDAGYLVLASLAKDNLGSGADVILDAVNPVELTRRLWRETADEAGVDLINVEVVCEDVEVHRKRVEIRVSDIAGMSVPSWRDVMAREYEPWAEDRIVVDTSHCTVSACVAKIVAALDAGYLSSAHRM